MKRAIQESVKLSPLDTNKKIYAYADPLVIVGMANLLLQRKDENDMEKGYHIISCGGNLLKLYRGFYWGKF